jgi:hypothetical protein
MSAILLYYYCGGWAMVAHACRDSCCEELSLGLFIGLLFFWPLVFVFSALDWMLFVLENVIVWRRT